MWYIFTRTCCLHNHSRWVSYMGCTNLLLAIVLVPPSLYNWLLLSKWLIHISWLHRQMVPLKHQYTLTRLCGVTFHMRIIWTANVCTARTKFLSLGDGYRLLENVLLCPVYGMYLSFYKLDCGHHSLHAINNQVHICVQYSATYKQFNITI